MLVLFRIFQVVLQTFDVLIALNPQWNISIAKAISIPYSKISTFFIFSEKLNSIVARLYMAKLKSTSR